MTTLTFNKTNILAAIAEIANVIKQHHGFDPDNGWAQVNGKGITENIGFGQFHALSQAEDFITCGDWGVSAEGKRFSRKGLQQALRTSIDYVVNRFGFDTEALIAPDNIACADLSEANAREYGRFLIFQRIYNMLEWDRVRSDDIIDPRYRVSNKARNIANLFKEMELGNDIIDEIKSLLKLCEEQNPSKGTHYDRLNDWSKPIYQFLHDMLSKHGFINGGKAKGLNQPSKAAFWWEMYDVPNYVIYSPNLATVVSDHHSSAYERNEALKIELANIIKLIS